MAIETTPENVSMVVKERTCRIEIEAPEENQYTIIVHRERRTFVNGTEINKEPFCRSFKRNVADVVGEKLGNTQLLIGNILQGIVDTCDRWSAE